MRLGFNGRTLDLYDLSARIAIMVSVENKISLVSVHTEGHRHMAQRIIPFLKERQPEVVLLQDCFKRGMNMIADGLGLEPAFAPHERRELYFDHGNIEVCGVATLSRYGFTDKDIFYYVRDAEKELPMHQEFMNRPGEEVARLRRAALLTDVDKGLAQFRFANLYFTWTPDGQASDYQRKDLQVLLNYFSMFSEIILCGDFNAPRGREIFDKLSAVYTDNIPTDVLSTLDPQLHYAARVKGLQLVVDGLFTTSGYRARDIEVVSGVSDHCAVVATVSKV